MIKKMEKFAKKKVILGTPHGHFHQDAYDGNALQEHHSSWEIEDIEKLGYSVFGQGSKVVYGEKGLYRKFSSQNIFIKFFLQIIAYLLSPFIYFNPKFGAHIIAVKNIH